MIDFLNFRKINNLSKIVEKNFFLIILRLLFKNESGGFQSIASQNENKIIK